MRAIIIIKTICNRQLIIFISESKEAFWRNTGRVFCLKASFFLNKVRFCAKQ